jgi:hypothetical protein
MTSYTVYTDLISQHPTSEALIAWLQSEDGGLLKVRDSRKGPDDHLVVIYYNKESNASLAHVPHFRSVVWDMCLNVPVCVAPAKADTSEPTTFVAEDFLDGVMLNMFWDRSCWRLASRSQLDAGNTFYSRRPFLSLFMEAVQANGLNLNDLDTNYNYSWVLQHPQERVVVEIPYGIPRLRLVSMSQFSGTNYRTLYTPEDALPPAFVELLPKRHVLPTLKDVQERVTAWGKQFGPKFKGLMVKSPDGRRWAYTSKEYEAALALRGNNAKLSFVWLERWSEKKLNQYLALYPEEAHAATAVVDGFKACTQEAYDLYHKIYRERAFPLGQAPQKYRKLLWDIHAARAGAYFANLQEFMNKQDTARKLWLVNYEARYPQDPWLVNYNAVAPSDAAFAAAPSDDAVNQLIDELEGQAAVAEQDAAIEAEWEASRT